VWDYGSEPVSEWDGMNLTSLDEASGSSINPSILGLIVLLPCVSAVAAYMGFRDVLLGVFFVVGLSVFAVLKVKARHNDRIFILLVWSLSLSLILSSTLASDYLSGYDVHQEYFLALQTSINGLWSIQQNVPYSSLLSITVLPAMINIVSALSMLQIFKFVVPLAYSLVPLILYRIARKILAPGAAFISVFLFMSYDAFYVHMLALARQETAEILLVVLILVTLSPAIIRSISGRLSIALLTIGLVTSHYSIAYIYLVFLVFSFMTSRIWRRTVGLTMLMITSVTAMSWYAFVAGGSGMVVLSSSVSFVINNMKMDFFNPSFRPVEVLQAVGFVSVSGILTEMNRWTQILVQLCLLLGFFVLIRKTKKSPSERQMLPLMSVGIVLIGSAALLPGFAAQLTISRIYHITLLFASTCFVYGADRVQLTLSSIPSWIKNLGIVATRPRGPTRTQVLASTVLFLYFLFLAGWFSAVTSAVPASFVLDHGRLASSSDPAVSVLYYDYFTVLSDISGASWIHLYQVNGRPVCADLLAKPHVLMSYGKSLFLGSGNYLPDECAFSLSYVYLSEFNNNYGLGYTWSNTPGVELGSFPISAILPKLSSMNRIYSNGGATIYG